MIKTDTLTPLNIILVLVGLILMIIGCHRIVPFRLDRPFYWQNAPLVAMLIIGLLFLSTRQQAGDMRQWLFASLRFGGRFLPLMVLLCLVMGMGVLLTKLYFTEISGALTSHLAISTLISSAFVPTPNTLLPIIEKMWFQSAMQPYFIFFLQAASLMSFPLFMLRSVGFSNTEIPVKMYISGIIISLLMFPCMPAIYWLTNLIYEHYRSS